MALSLYVDRQTMVHRLHPVVKVVAMVCLFTAAYVSERPASLLPLFVGVLLLVTAAGALGNVRRLRLLFALVFAMTFIVWSLFFRGGVPWLHWGSFNISRAGLQFAFGMALKLVGFLGIGLLFLSTTRIEEFAFALTRVGVPHKVGFTMTLAFRLVPIFLDAAVTVVQAQRCRGFDFDRGGPLQRLRRYVPVIVPVFIGALRRADGMAMALEARGFQSTRPRTVFEQFRFGVADGMAVAGALLLAAIYVVLWRYGYTAVPLA